ncbi:hypothetical protein ACJMK2_008806, partial [Sinanodonta woodiana]
DFAVGVVQGDVFMSWQINNTDTSSDRFVVNPAGSTLIFYPASSVTGTVAAAFTNRVRDVGNVSLGNVSFTLLNLTAADYNKYVYKIYPGIEVGGQVLVIAGKPDNVSVMALSSPVEKTKYILQCSAQSTSVPPGMGLTMHYQWKWENGKNITMSDRYSFSSDQSSLTINPLKKEDDGIFVCEAWEHVGAVSRSALFYLTVNDSTKCKPSFWCTRGWCIGLCSTSGGLLVISVVTAIGVIIITEKWKDIESHMSSQILTISIAGVVVVVIVVSGVLGGIVCRCWIECKQDSES